MASGYSLNLILVVRFSISQIGKYIPDEDDAANVKKFLDGLEFDDSIQDVLYRTAGTCCSNPSYLSSSP